MEERKRFVIVLAAGKGMRMESLDETYSKVAYPILDKPLVNYVLDAAKPLQAENTFVVVGFGGEQTTKCVGDRAQIVWQKEVNGTGGAVMNVLPKIKEEDGDVFILCGDTPLLTTETINKIYRKHKKQESKLTICSTVLANPAGYGRVLREKGSYRVLGVRPYAEISEEEQELSEINSGIYIVDLKLLREFLPKLSRENRKDEYYLSDIVEMFSNAGHHVDAYVLEDPEDLYNINDRVQLAQAAKILRKRINKRLMLSGVSIEDPDTTYISPDAIIGKDTVIKANTCILGDCVIGIQNRIGPGSNLKHIKVGDRNHIPYCYLRRTEIGDDEDLTPFTVIK